MPDQTIEQEIQAKGLTAPRITPADIEAAIAAEFTYCVGHALNESGSYFGIYQTKDGSSAANEHARQALGLLTFCVLVMRNGFTVVGKSACASPENFDAALGRKIAREDAINQCWPLLGYELRTKLAAVPLHEPVQEGKYTRKDIKMMRTVYNPARRTELIQAELRDGTYVEVDLYYLPHRALQTEVEIVEAVLAKANGVRQ